LAVDLYHTQFVERREAAAREALEMAQRLGDPTAQFVALKSWHGSTWDPGAAKQRREAAAEMVQLAERSGDKEMAFHGHSLDVASLYELGDMEGADSKIHTCARLAEELRQPLYRWHMDVFRASRALLDGRLEEAERLTMEAYTLGQSVHPEVAFTVFGAQIFYVRWAQGRISEIDPQAVKSLAEQSPGVPGWGAALAFLYSQLGREEEARSEFESLAASNFEVLPRDGNWLVSIHLLSETCVFLRDSSRAEILYEHLLPYAELSVAGAPAVLSLGSVASMLGALAATMQRWDEAVAHFELALERNGRMGARPLTVRTLELYAQTLLARDRPEDRGMAFELMEQALEIARDVGMRGFAEEVEALRPKAQAAAT
jgi:tetratricopeptide (TPR) repeat protein